MGTLAPSPKGPAIAAPVRELGAARWLSGGAHPGHQFIFIVVQQFCTAFPWGQRQLEPNL